MSSASLGTGCVPRLCRLRVARSPHAQGRHELGHRWKATPPSRSQRSPPGNFPRSGSERFSKLVSGLHSSKKIVGFFSRSLTPFCIPEEARSLWDFTCAPCCWGSRSKHGASELGRTLRWGGGRSWTLAYPWTGAVHESARSRTRSDSSVVDTCIFNMARSRSPRTRRASTDVILCIPSWIASPCEESFDAGGGAAPLGTSWFARRRASEACDADAQDFRKHTHQIWNPMNAWPFCKHH